jgi:hypothetical protein
MQKSREDGNFFAMNIEVHRPDDVGCCQNFPHNAESLQGALLE